MRKVVFLSLLLVTSLTCLGQQVDPSEWHKLIDKKDCKKAETLCTAWTKSKDTRTQSEAQKCLSNVEGRDV